MPKLVWDKTTDRTYETGVDHGVLYVKDTAGEYGTGVAWNGLTSVSQSPSGAEPTALYADNIKYLNLMSAEEFAATIEAYTYPEEFEVCEGFVEKDGVVVSQQAHREFAFAYRTKIGSADNPDLGYKLHIVYGCLAQPTERTYETVNDSPDAITFSWEISTTPVEVAGMKPTAHLVIDSTRADATKLKDLEETLFGRDADEEKSISDKLPTLLMPDAVLAALKVTE